MHISIVNTCVLKAIIWWQESKFSSQSKNTWKTWSFIQQNGSGFNSDRIIKVSPSPFASQRRRARDLSTACDYFSGHKLVFLCHMGPGFNPEGDQAVEKWFWRRRI